jgi:hypothetical protein
LDITNDPHNFSKTHASAPTWLEVSSLNMASSVMRLRLVVRRHGLPEVKIVWPCTSPEDLTVAGLLGEVNEVITLEGTDWGLEDYAVELGDQDGSSFECLHFQQVSKILKHDDQVM